MKMNWKIKENDIDNSWVYCSRTKQYVLESSLSVIFIYLIIVCGKYSLAHTKTSLSPSFPSINYVF